MTESTDGFYSRLAKAQAEFDKAELDSRNPHDRYHYASYGSLVAAARPHLAKHGIIALHHIRHSATTEGEESRQWVGIDTVLRDDATEYNSGTVWIPVHGRALSGGKEGMVDAKAYGAAITYGKRYGLELALGIGREDEDSVDQQPARSSQPQRPAPRRTDGQRQAAAEQASAVNRAIASQEAPSQAQRVKERLTAGGNAIVNMTSADLDKIIASLGIEDVSVYLDGKSIGEFAAQDPATWTYPALAHKIVDGVLAS